MAAKTEHGGRRGGGWRIAGWGTAGLALLLPWVTGAPWTASDFVVMGVLLGAAGLLVELAAAASGSLAYRAGAGAAVVAAVLLIWVNGAVGFFGDEDNPANLVFAGVIAVAGVGVALARFRPAGMVRAMLATAAAQVLVGAVGLAAGWGSPGDAGVYEAVMGTGAFAALWLLSAALFRRAAR